MLKFILYYVADGEKTIEWNGNTYFDLEKPVKVTNRFAYAHTFGCSLWKAIFDWRCLIQILHLEPFGLSRFYHSVCPMTDDKWLIHCATKFNILLFPLVYIFSLLDQRKFHRVMFVRKHST